MECKFCGKKLVGKDQKKYCSQECSKRGQRGENHHNWKGGLQVNNPDYYREYNRIYGKTRGKRKRYPETDKIWRENNREKLRASCRRWREKHPDRAKSCRTVCRLRRRGAGNITKEMLQSIYEGNIKEYGTLTCYLCKKPILFGQDSIDHLIPITRGGLSNIENLAIAHRKCNTKKYNKLLEEVPDGFFAKCV